MLTREHAIAEYDFRAGLVHPDRLTQRTHGHYLRYAEQLLDVYRQGVGRTRRDLHRAVEAVFAGEEDCPARRISAFCKLLDDAATYAQDRRGQAAKLRREVFRLSGPRHPLVHKADRLFESEEATVKAEIAKKLGQSWEEIDRQLFADIIEFHRLAKFDGYPDGPALLARYNVAQVQAALYDAVSMTVWAQEDFKTILRYAKLAHLMHAITPVGEQEYRLRLDGPASVLRQTRRYGVHLARFVPALIACRDWRLHAKLHTRRSGWDLALALSAQDGLHSHLPALDEFDSHVEKDFFAKWGPEPRDGWSLSREGAILSRGQKTFVPDFVFRHRDGQTVLMEIIGFWTPEYLQAKFQTLQCFQDQAILLAVAESTGQQLPDLPPDTISYKTVLLLKNVLDRLQRRTTPTAGNGRVAGG
jgi:uncharacterized protein